MELFVIIVNGLQPLTIITECSTLDVEAVLDPPLIMEMKTGLFGLSRRCNVTDTWNSNVSKIFGKNIILNK